MGNNEVKASSAPLIEFLPAGGILFSFFNDTNSFQAQAIILEKNTLIFAIRGATLLCTTET